MPNCVDGSQRNFQHNDFKDVPEDFYFLRFELQPSTSFVWLGIVFLRDLKYHATENGEVG